MRYLFVLFFMLLSFSKAESFLESDYNFIDTAFDGIKPVTDKQFNDTINKLTPKPVENTFKGRLKAFLFGPEYGVEEPPKGQDVEFDNGADLKAIHDLTNGVYYIKLVAPIISDNGKVIPLGNYKIKEETINSIPYLVFYQGRDNYGKLKLKKYEDNLKKENDIVYSRVDIVSSDIIRIVYSTLDETKCTYARVYLQN